MLLWAVSVRVNMADVWDVDFNAFVEVQFHCKPELPDHAFA